MLKLFSTGGLLSGTITCVCMLSSFVTQGEVSGRYVVGRGRGCSDGCGLFCIFYLRAYGFIGYHIYAWTPWTMVDGVRLQHLKILHLEQAGEGRERGKRKAILLSCYHSKYNALVHTCTQ